MNPLTVLLGVIAPCRERLSSLERKVDRILSTLVDFQAKFAEQNAALATIAEAQAAVPDLLSNISADIARIKEQVGNSGGLNAAETSAAFDALTETSGKLAVAASIISANVQALKDVAAIVPEPDPAPVEEPSV